MDKGCDKHKERLKWPLLNITFRLILCWMIINYLVNDIFCNSSKSTYCFLPCPFGYDEENICECSSANLLTTIKSYRKVTLEELQGHFLPEKLLFQLEGFTNTSMQNSKNGGIWGKWKDSTPCSKSCDIGYKYMERVCKQGDCNGSNTRISECMIINCNLHTWGQWTHWSSCKRNSHKIQLLKRYRICSQIGKCSGLTTEFKKCGGGAEWSAWSSWSSCSKSCGGGVRSRTTHCVMVRGLATKVNISFSPLKEAIGTSPSMSCTGLTYIMTSGREWNTASQTQECNKIPCTLTTSGNITKFILKHRIKRSPRSKYKRFDFLEIISKSPNICAYGRLLHGRFTTTIKDQVLCYYADGVIDIYSIDNSELQFVKSVDAGFCKLVFKINLQNAQINTVDINKDGFTDFVCFHHEYGQIQVTYNHDGNFDHFSGFNLFAPKCNGREGKTLKFGDFNNDGKPDILCAEPNKGITAVYINRMFD